MFYSRGVTNELIRTLSQSQRISQGLPGLKPSSNFVLPAALITRPTTNVGLIMIEVDHLKGIVWLEDKYVVRGVKIVAGVKQMLYIL